MSIYGLKKDNILNGCIYAVGGFNVPFLRYDLNQNKWMTLAPIRLNQTRPGLTVLNDQLYAVGGHKIQLYATGRSPQSLSDVTRYDPVQNTLTPVVNMNLRRSNVGVGVLNGQLYAVGGNTDGIPRSSVERYDPKDNTWIFVAAMNFRRSSVGVAVIGSRLYAVGGCDGNSYLASVERYDPNHNKWTVIADMSSPRKNANVVILGGQLYVMGGSLDSNSIVSVERYDSYLNKWNIVPYMSLKDSYSSAVVANGNLYSVGMRNNQYLSRRFPLLYRYDPVENLWVHVTTANRRTNDTMLEKTVSMTYIGV